MGRDEMWRHPENAYPVTTVKKSAKAHPDFLIFWMPLVDIEAPSPSPEQDKAVSEHSIPLGKQNTIYYHDFNIHLAWSLLHMVLIFSAYTNQM